MNRINLSNPKDSLTNNQLYNNRVNSGNVDETPHYPDTILDVRDWVITLSPLDGTTGTATFSMNFNGGRRLSVTVNAGYWYYISSAGVIVEDPDTNETIDDDTLYTVLGGIDDIVIPESYTTRLNNQTDNSCGLKINFVY